MANGASDQDVRVRVLGEVDGSLNANLEIARQRMKQTAAEVRSLAAEAAASSAPTAEMVANIRSAQAEAAAATREFKALGGTVAGTHGSISTATREFRALFDELSSGRTRMTPGTLAIIGQRVFGLGPAALAAYGGVALLAAGLVYLGIKALETADSVDKLALSGLGTKGFAASEAQITEYADRLSALPQVSSDTAEKVVGAFQTMANRSEASISGLSAATEAWAELSGQETDKAAQQLAKVFSAPLNAQAREFMVSLRGVTAAEIDAYDKAKAAGDTYGAQRLILEALSSTIDASKDRLDQHSASVHTNWRNFVEWLGVAAEFGNTETANQALLDQSTQKWNALTAAIHGALGELAHVSATPAEKLSEAVNIADKIDTTRVHIAELQGDVAKLKAELADPSATAAMKANFTSAIQKAQTEISKLQKQPHTDEYANFVAMEDAKADAAKAGSRVRIQVAEEEVAKAKALFGSESTEYYRAEAKLNAAKREGVAAGVTAFRQGGEEEIATAREKIAEINADETLGGKERVAAVQKVWQDLLAGTKLNAIQRLEVQRAMHESEAQAERQAGAEKKRIDQDNERTSVELAKVGFEQRKAMLEEDVAAGRISKQQELAALIDLAAEERRVQTEAANDAEKGYAQDSANFIHNENEKKLIAARTETEIAQLRRQIATANAEDEVAIWKKAYGEITSAEDTMISGIISGQQTAKQILFSMIDDFLTKELEADLHYLTAKALFSEAALAKDKSLSQAGLLWDSIMGQESVAAHTAAETEKTAATATGVGVRMGARETEEAAENASFLVRAARWIASELGMTTATTAGATARTTEQIAAQTAGKATESALNVGSAESYSAVAATGAAASVAWIPVVGPALAQAAAASTYAALQPYAALASLDKGTNYVPHDMIAQIHKGERIIPAADNLALLRAAGAGAGAPAKGSSTMGNIGNMELKYAPVIHAEKDASMENLLHTQGRTLLQWFGARMRDGSLKMAMGG